MKSCQLWGLATSAHYKKISMEETKRNQKKPVSLDWLRENLQETMVFTIKYRVFLWIFPSSNSMTVASSQWSYEEGHFPLQMWHFLKKNPSKIRNQSAAAFCRGPQHGLAGCAENISDSEHGETGHGQLILWDEDPIFVTQFLWLKHINFPKIHSCGENPTVHPHIFGWQTSIAKSIGWIILNPMFHPIWVNEIIFHSPELYTAIKGDDFPIHSLWLASGYLT